MPVRHDCHGAGHRWYIAFLIHPENPSATIQVWAALGTVLVFFLLQAWGVKEQSLAMVVMTYGAILGLVIFWCLAATSFSWERVWTQPLFAGGQRLASGFGCGAVLSLVAGDY